MKILKYLLVLPAILGSFNVQATIITIGDKEIDTDLLPHFHRRNIDVKPEDTLLAATCQELDAAITYLTPATYQYKPDFYDDQYNGAAIWGSTIVEFAWLYLPYSWFISYHEEGRQHRTFYKIEKLRMAKAIKQCYVQ